MSIHPRAQQSRGKPGCSQYTVAAVGEREGAYHRGPWTGQCVAQDDSSRCRSSQVRSGQVRPGQARSRSGPGQVGAKVEMNERHGGSSKQKALYSTRL